MSNVRHSGSVEIFRYCRSRAFRAGYEDARENRPARFGEWGRWSVAYEHGRLVAAFIRAGGEDLRPIPRAAAFDRADLQWIAGGLHRAKAAGILA